MRKKGRALFFLQMLLLPRGSGTHQEHHGQAAFRRGEGGREGGLPGPQGITLTYERMKLEDQVVSLELAKKLKKLRVKQESFVFWINTNTDFPELHYKGFCTGGISAFTVAELGEMLPAHIEFHFHTGDADGQLWHITGDGRGISLESIWAKTEADARAQMLIYLIENGLYEPEK